jgi:uncharacterized protein (TIGR01777 family)
MKVLVTGSHGLIGSALVPMLITEGHLVTRLARRPPGQTTSSGADLYWDPAGGVLDAAALRGFDAVVHLAGVGIGDERWSPARRQAILESRTKSTSLLSERLAECVAGGDGPMVLLSSSAVGYYGDRGNEELTEDSPVGSGFVSGVCSAWETATGPAGAAGVRVVHLRTGIVQSRLGGSLKKQLPLFKLGLGGRLGSGTQWTSWISLGDEVRAILHLLGTGSVSGPVNLTSPHPVTNKTYTTILSSVVGRPALLPVPRFALEAALGRDMASELVLASAKVQPAKLTDSGFSWSTPDLESALRATLAS